jgi:hypothetical protein
MKIGDQVDLVGCASGVGHSSYNLDAKYYKQKFIDMVNWLQAREDFYDKEACAELDRMRTPAAKMHISSGNATKCARMWIRNHVLLPEA